MPNDTRPQVDLPRLLAVCGDPVGRGALLALLAIAGGITFLVLTVAEVVAYRIPLDALAWAGAWGGLLVSSAGAMGLHSWAGAKAQQVGAGAGGS